MQAVMHYSRRGYVTTRTYVLINDQWARPCQFSSVTSLCTQISHSQPLLLFSTPEAFIPQIWNQNRAPGELQRQTNSATDKMLFSLLHLVKLSMREIKENAVLTDTSWKVKFVKKFPFNFDGWVCSKFKI